MEPQLPCQSELRKGRYSQPGQIYHITFAKADRNTPFDELSMVTICRYLNSKDLKHYCHLQCWVVMPDHVHCLVETNNHVTLSDAVKRLKSQTARLINKNMNLRGIIWQKGFHDHALRHDEDVRDIARYIVANPIRAGLVRSAQAYPYWNAIWV